MIRGLDPAAFRRMVETPASQLLDQGTLLDARVRALTARHLLGPGGRVRPSRFAAILAVITAVAIATGAVVPLPYRSQLLLPILAALVGFMLAARWGDRPGMIVWASTGMFVGASAAQRLGAPLLLLPLAAGGLVLGLVLAYPDATSSPRAGDDDLARP